MTGNNRKFVFDADACPYKIRHPHYTVPWTRKMLYKMVNLFDL